MKKIYLLSIALFLLIPFALIGQEAKIAVATRNHDLGRVTYSGMMFLGDNEYHKGGLYDDANAAQLFLNMVKHTSKKTTGKMAIFNNDVTSANASSTKLATFMESKGWVVDKFSASASLNTLAGQSAYDIIMLGCDGYGYTAHLNDASFNTNLQTYVSNGGGLLVVGWLSWKAGQAANFKNMIQAISPFSNVGQYGFINPNYSLVVQNNTHHIMENVPYVTVGTEWGSYPTSFTLRSDATTIATYDIFSPTGVASNSPLCDGNTLNLSSFGGVSYSWSGPNGFTSTNQNPSITNVSSVNAGTYTCVILKADNTYSTKTLTVTVNPGGASITNNVQDAFVNIGDNATFSVSVTGSSLTYQWQVDDGTGFVDITDNATYSGATSSELTLSNVTNDMFGKNYRCKITPGTCPPNISAVGTLKLFQLPTITSFSPAKVNVGSTLTISGTGFSNTSLVTIGGVSVSYTVVNATTITIVVPSGITGGAISITNPSGTVTNAVEVGSNTTASCTTGWSNAWQTLTTNAAGVLSSVTLKLDNTDANNNYGLYLELHSTDANPSSANPNDKFNSLLETSNTITINSNTNFSDFTFNFPGTTALAANTAYYVVLKEASGNPAGTGDQRISFNCSNASTDGGAGNNFGTLYYKFDMVTAVEVDSNTDAICTTGWSGAWQTLTTNAAGVLNAVTLKLNNTDANNDYGLYLELHSTDADPSSASPGTKFNSLLETSNTLTINRNTNTSEFTFNFPGTSALAANTAYYVVLKGADGNPSGTGNQRVYFNCVANNTDGGSGGNFGTLYYKFSTISLLAVNQNPSISTIVDQELLGSTPSPEIAFTVNDEETNAADLTVTAISSNTTLIPNANIVLGGTDGNRSVTVTAANNQFGTATITLTVTDANGATATTTFDVEVKDPTCSVFSASDFILNGNASRNNTIITLTPDAGGQSGSVWNKYKIFLDKNFTVKSKVFLGSNNASGADGIAFVLQNQSVNAGSQGGGLGYAGISPSFAVEFDTYNNGSMEPTADHIAIIKNGAAAGVHNTYATPFEVEMEDGQWHDVEFTWNASTKNFQVWYDGVKRFDITEDLKANIFNNAEYVFWGFTGATGGSTNLQQVEIPEYCLVKQVGITPQAGTNNPSAATTLCAGADVVLEADFSSTYQWFKDGVAIDNATEQSITVTETGTYTVEATSGLGNISTAVPVEVAINPIPNVDQPLDITVQNGETIPATLFSGLVNGATYSWTSTTTSFGLAASGNGNIASFTANYNGNTTDQQVIATVTVTPSANDCIGESKTFTITVTLNAPPTDISLSASSINENNVIGAIIANLSSTDPNANDTHTYTLVSGSGDTDNARFSIAGNELKAALSFDYETKNSYSVRIRTTDAGDMTYEKTFTITVNNVNEAPIAMALSKANLFEANTVGDAIGTLSSTDVDAGDTFTYTLVNGFGDIDNAMFSITNNTLKAATSFVYTIRNSYKIRIRTTDAGGLTFEKDYTITISQTPTITGTGNTTGSSTSTPASSNPSISKGYSSQLQVSGQNLVSYSWSPATGLSNTNTANPVANPSQTTTYTVTVTNGFGSSTTVNITVTVVVDYNVTPYNIMTPNGDGENDTWVIENLSSYPDNQVKVFDKAGREVFSKQGYANDWNGTNLTPDTYYYVLTFGSGVSPKKGFITIVR